MVDPLTAEGSAQRRRRSSLVIRDRIGTLPVPDRQRAGVGRFADLAFPGALECRLIAADMGQHTERGIALAAFAQRTLCDDRRFGDPVLDPSAFWRHTFDVAFAAEFLNAHAVHYQNPDVLFTAAVLHDVGELVLNHLAPRSYERARKDARRRCRAPAVEEESQLGVDHAHAGGRLAARWLLPRNIVDAIRWHLCPPAVITERTSYPELVALIQLADALCCRQRFGHRHGTLEADRTILAQQIGIPGEIDPTIVQQARDNAATLLERVAPLLGVLPHQGEIARQTARVSTGGESSRRDQLSAGTLRRLTHAVARFAPRNGSEDHLPDICAAIAQCCADVFSLKTAVAFVTSPARTEYFCGAIDGDLTAAESLCLDPTDVDDVGESTDSAGIERLPPIMPAPPMSAPVLERFRRYFAGDDPWMLPIVQNGALAGGVLLDLDAFRRSQTGRSDVVEMLVALFQTAVARAVDGAAESPAASDIKRRNAPKNATSASSLSKIAEMAAGAAHELNTPLAVISGCAQVLAREAQDPGVVRTLETIHGQTKTCSEILDQLIAFAKPRTPQPAIIALEPWIAALCNQWGTRSPHPIPPPIISFAEPGIRTYADPEQLSTILDALISNAIDALPRRNPSLEINSPSTDSDETVVVVVLDNGHGMSADVLERACDPFFSHRSAGRRRGLGLATARRLAEINNGRLWLESAPDAGTTAYVELPSANRR